MDEKIDKVISRLLAEFDFLHEMTVQKGVFLVEKIAVEKTGSRVTTVDFYPRMYGPYSPEVRGVLETMSADGKIDETPDILNRKRVPVYSSNNTPTLPNEVIDCIETAAERMREIGGPNEIAAKTKEMSENKNTRYENVIKFN